MIWNLAGTFMPVNVSNRLKKQRKRRLILKILKEVTIMSNSNNPKTSDKSKRYKRIGIISIPAVAAIVICAIFVFNIFGTGAAYAQNLMKGITPSKVDKVKLSDSFVSSAADFSVELFKKSTTEKKNSLVSPVSVYLALAMTENGADGKTLKEFESVLGKYNLAADDINKYCSSFSKLLTDTKTGKLNIANSIWYRQNDSLTVNKDFLQTNADYFSSAAYSADFNSNQTVNDINNWVKSNTGGLIDSILDKIDPQTVMYLINTLYFEAEWEEVYSKEDVRIGDFKLEDGSALPAQFMYSSESSYIKDNNAQGFIKPYKDNKYSFLALLPDEGVSIDSYVSSLTGEKLLSLIKNKSNANVNAAIPKFKTEYSKNLVESLKSMGLNECFIPDSANFSKMGSSDSGNLYVGNVLHKTYIQVDELGTKAGAVTSVEMNLTSMPVEIKEVILNRPFVYAIIDNETGLPLFIGIMRNPK